MTATLTRTVQPPLPVTGGWLAGTVTVHPWQPMDATQCRACYGWYDDPRHLTPMRPPARPS